MYSNTTPHTLNLKHYPEADCQKKGKQLDFIFPLLLILIGCAGLLVMLLKN